MRSEFNRVGAEYHPTEEYHQPHDPDAITSREITPPAEEIAPCASEFPCMDDIEESGDESDSPSRAKQKKEHFKKRAHQKLLRQMSYLVTSVVAVAIVSGTISNESIVENVQAMGGTTKGDLRFSIQWNDDKYNPNDFDAHCIEPNGYTIMYSNSGYTSPSGGTLDVDIVSPQENVTAVENIIYPSKSEMADGVYLLRVHCFSHNGGKSGFRAEVAIRGRVYKFHYNKELEPGEYIDVANVTVEKGKITMKRLLGGS